ncbi:glycosyltransferase family 4 protein [Fibrella aquatilis]|uniref:Glycosyltransferase family 4 protein n=1 Tax=Fibrella aquatilis TaxID=2817059 RepID=A0A939JZI7_9BACT|nr:glycosyltransferase family 1 protein [Fibrella aquatilis]MBO0933189.1 glycosyltransferase family 4 protein [Fibrella aquatilis]
MRIILLGNYLPDRQQSMHRFALMLQEGLEKAAVQTEIWYPTLLFGKLTKSTTSGLGKWLSYLDKWVVFSLLVWWRVNVSRRGEKDLRFHICDHSNAPYLGVLPTDRTVITCHDVLAIRGALGHADAYCPASKTGKIYQKWILKHLTSARKIAAVTQTTLNQLQVLAPVNRQPEQRWLTIHNAFNAPFAPTVSTEAQHLLSRAGLQTDKPFILYVGSDLPRKNRSMLLDMVAQLGDQWQGSICYAGQAVEGRLVDHARKLNLQERVVSVARPDHATLQALYSHCEALVFPSFSEGFGWPVIEAQACEAPVISSTLAPMPEVSGGAALFADPTRPHEFARALLTLQDARVRSQLIEQGRSNCTRFSDQAMISAYLDLHHA